MKNEFREKLEIIRKEKLIAGMSVAVTDRKSIIFSEGFGNESIERPSVTTSPDALYRIASISKVVTGITIMRLCELGKLELDRPIREYIPWLNFKSEAALRLMTLRHLLSHTAGLPKEYTPDGPREESALEASLMAGLPALEFHALPGEGKYLYSNWGVRIASYMAERVTDRRFTELAYQYAIKPLGMERTTYDLHDAATYPLSLPHEDDGNGGLKTVHHIEENAARYAAGGLFSNTADLCRLARMILNGGKADSGEAVLSEETLNEMMKLHTNENESGGYGLTMMIRNIGGRRMYGHLGNAMPYGSSLFCNLESGFGVVTLMNTFRSEARTEIPEAVFEILLK